MPILSVSVLNVVDGIAGKKWEPRSPVPSKISFSNSGRWVLWPNTISVMIRAPPPNTRRGTSGKYKHAQNQ